MTQCNGKCTRHAISPSCPKHGGKDKHAHLFGRIHLGLHGRKDRVPKDAESSAVPVA